MAHKSTIAKQRINILNLEVKVLTALLLSAYNLGWRG